MAIATLMRAKKQKENKSYFTSGVYDIKDDLSNYKFTRRLHTSCQEIGWVRATSGSMHATLEYKSLSFLEILKIVLNVTLFVN